MTEGMDVTFESAAHRFRLAGPCRRDDLERLAQDLDAHRDPGTPLIVDLTAVTRLDPEPAALLVDVRDTDPGRRGRISLLRRRDSPADRAILAAETTDRGTD